MFKFNNSIVPNKVHIGWHFSSNKYVYRDAYSALKSIYNYIYISGSVGEKTLIYYLIVLHRSITFGTFSCTCGLVSPHESDQVKI